MQEPNIPKDLCYVTGQNFENYLHDMKLTQEHARINHQTIANIIISKMNWHIIDEIHTMHNYIDIENKILRKGSVSAKAGERLIIPMNMRDGSLICIGKGNPDWNYSAPHIWNHWKQMDCSIWSLSLQWVHFCRPGKQICRTNRHRRLNRSGFGIIMGSHRKYV